MNYTEYYKLLKPLEEEQYDINIHNANSDMIDFELNRLKEKDTEIQQNITEKSLLWNDKYTKEQVDAKIAGIEIPTKISDLENDSGLGSITGIKGSNEAEYRHTGDINISADDIGALRITELHGTDDHVLNLDAITDFGMYRISNDGVMWVKYNNGDSQIDCKYMDLFVGGSDRFKYQVVFPLDYYKKFRIRFITISETGSTEFSAWSEIATLKELLDYIDARCVKNTQILNTQEQIDANTSNQNIAGALAVKQIKHDLEQQIIAAVSGVTGVKGNAESAYRTGNVNVTPANVGAVNKAGDTMNGNLVMKNVCLTDGVHSRVVMEMYDDKDGTTNYGSELVIGAAGNTFIGGGESPGSLRNALTSGAASGEYYTAIAERMYFSSDTDIYLYSNCQNIANRAGIIYDATGSLRPLVNNTRSLGSSSVKWAEVYATTFHGTLDGTATRADRLGSVPVGHHLNPIYIGNDGIIKASNAAQGDRYRPVYMNRGAISACETTLTNPIFEHVYASGRVTSTEKIDLEPNHTYLLIITTASNTIGGNSIYGGTARVIMCPNGDINPRNVTILSLGTTTNTGFTITAMSYAIEIKAASSYAAHYVIYDILNRN